MQALDQKTCFRFAIKAAETDSEGKTTYKDCESCEMNGQIYLEQEAVFDGSKLTLNRDYAFGQGISLSIYIILQTGYWPQASASALSHHHKIPHLSQNNL